MLNILSTNKKLENEVEKGVKMLSVDMKKHHFISWVRKEENKEVSLFV
ncbi:MAG: hypothetical protein QM493_07115 [Sulfurovum sp.]